MRQIHYYIATTLDGYIAREDGSIDGFLMEGEHAEDFVRSFESYDSVLMGRGTYEFGFRFGLEPGQPAYPGLTHHIFSQSLSFKETEEVRLVQEDSIAYIKELTTQDGKDIWLCGGGLLAGSLLAHGLIDKVITKVNPIVYGDGKKLFEGKAALHRLEHIRTKQYANGVVLLEHRVLKV